MPSRRGRPALRRHFKTREVETGRDRAADQRPGAEAFGLLPSVSGNRRLRPLASRQIGAEPQRGNAVGVHNPERQRRARVPMPDLGGVDAVPARTLAARQQEINRRRSGARTIHDLGVAKGLAKVPAFRVRLQSEQPHDIGARQFGHAAGLAGGAPHPLKLSFAALILANTCAGALPLSPMRAASDASSARRNGLAAFSTAIVVGSVGLPAARSAATSSARAVSAALSGSIVRANLTFAAVYSWPQ